MFMTKNLPGLTGGISQKNPATRPENCSQDLQNALVNAARGVDLKRPHSSLRFTMDKTANVEGAFVKELRTTYGDYLLVVNGDATTPVRIYRLSDGVAANITFDTDAKAYLANSFVKTKIRASTLLDTTFIVNQAVTVTEEFTTSTATGELSAGYINLLNADSVASYLSLIMTGYSVSGSVTITDIATDAVTLVGTLNGDAGFATNFTAVIADVGVIGIKRNSPTTASPVAMALSCVSSSGTASLEGISNERIGVDSAGNNVFVSYVTSADKLPRGAFDKAVFQIGTGSAKYFVKWDNAAKVYNECADPRYFANINPDTAPVLLRQSADLVGVPQFSLDIAHGTDELTSNPRSCGDLSSAPSPSFVGKSITDVFFFKSRLCFLCSESVVMSQTNDFFNFYPTTATEVLDTDPIDISPDTKDLQILTDVMPFSETILLFSGKRQFLLHSGQRALTTKTVMIESAGDFTHDTTSFPVVIGSNVYFLEPRGDCLGLREYFSSSDSLSYSAELVSRDLPAFIPKGITQILGVSALDMLLMFKSGDTSVYVYQFLFGGEQKILSSFHKWTFSSAIQGAMVLDNELFIIHGFSSTSYTVNRLKLDNSKEFSGTPFVFHLDKAERKATGSYSGSTGLTTWTLTETPTTVSKLVIESSGKELEHAPTTGTSTTAVGDYSAVPVIHGFPFTSTLEFSELTLRDENGVALPNIDLRIQKIILEVESSGYLKILVTPLKRSAASYEQWFFELDNLGDETGETEVVVLKDATLKQMVLTKTKGVSLKVTSDSYLPCTLKSAAFEIDVVKETS